MAAKDNLLEYFDLGKKFEGVQLCEKVERERLEESEGNAEGNDFWDDVHEDEEGYNDDQDYAKEFKERELREMAKLREEAETLGIGNENEPLRRVVEGSHMSEIDALTSVESISLWGGVANVGDEWKRQIDFSVSRGPNLPIAIYKEPIMNKINTSQVTVISGETGCGKTTQVPQFILEHHCTRKKRVNIVITQPRKLAAQAMAKRICYERGWKLGKEVGYKVGLDKGNCSPDTVLLFCTTGILKKMLISKKCLNEWTHVILDEVHDREQDMDFVMLLCKRFLNSNSRRVKLILMSATMQPDELLEYYSCPLPNSGMKEYPAFQEIKVNRRFKISEYYLDSIDKNAGIGPNSMNTVPQLYDECVEVCKKLIINFDSLEKSEKVMERMAVLVFLPGENEIVQVRKCLEMNGNHDKYRWKIFPLHSRIPTEEHESIFQKLGRNVRKIILSTNIAESSITVEDVRYVIDFCLTKNLVADPDTNYVTLKLEWASKNNCIQRSGRCGRVSDGRVFRLISEDFYKNCIPGRHKPEILRAPLDKVVLDTKLLDVGPPREILALAIAPPDLSNIHKTMMHLKEIGALLPTVRGVQMKEDGDLTVLGEIVASLPVDVRLGKLIVLGHLFNVLEDTIIIAAGLSNKSIFSNPFNKRLKAYEYKLMWADGSFSDCIAIKIAYEVWKIKKDQGAFKRAITGRNERSQEEIWCRNNCLQVKSLREVEKTIEEINVNLKRSRIEKFNRPNLELEMSESERTLLLHVVIFGAFYPNYFLRMANSIEEKEVKRDLLGWDPMTSLYLTGFPVQQANYAPLYYQQIKKLFESFVSDPDLIDCAVDGSKIVVSFAKGKDDKSPYGAIDNRVRLFDEENLTGSIIHQVYCGLKLRYLPKESLRLFMYTDEKAKSEFQALKEKIVALETDLVSIETLKVIDPPSVNNLRVEIVHVNNPNSFWIHYTTPEFKMELHELHDAIESLTVNSENPKYVKDKLTLQKHRLYLAPYDDITFYYRCRIETIPWVSQGNLESDKVLVFFLDYGNSEWVHYKDIVEVDTQDIKRYPSIIYTPVLALEASLAFVKPNQLRNKKGLWDEEVIERFKEEIEKEGKTVEVQIYSVVPQRQGPLVSIELISSRRKETINDWLKKAHGKELPLAEYSGESFLSEENHRFRLNHSHNSIKGIEERQGVAMGSKWNHLPPGADEGRGNVTYLKGPYHPLEFKLFGLHQIGHTKSVNIGYDSVNSVLLDRFPNEATDQWLVAGDITLTAKGDSLQLRSTDFLPNIPGLGSILIMIFAPKVELRCDPKRERYTGCLVGLGDRPRDWGLGKRTGCVQPGGNDRIPYHRDHDMEVNFDVDINEEDMALICKIRYHINWLLSRHGIDEKCTLEARQREGITRLSNPRDLAKGQDKIRQHLWELLDRERTYTPKKYFVPEYKWNQIPEGYGYSLVIDALPGYLQPLDLIKLKRYDSERVKAQTLNWLWKIYDEGKMTIDDQQEEYSMPYCPICPRRSTFYELSDLVDHLDDKIHCLREQEFFKNSTDWKNLVRFLLMDDIPSEYKIRCPICPERPVFKTLDDARFHLQSDGHERRQKRLQLLL